MISSTQEKINILVVEDNLGDFELFETFFEQNKKKSHFVLARDGHEAIDFLFNREETAQVPFHLVIMDINLPRIDGREVLKRMKASPATRRIPVLILTSSDNLEDVRFCYDAGASCVLSKPYNLESSLQLFRLIEAFWVNTICFP